MLKIYDADYHYLTLLDKGLKDVCIIDTLATGQRALEFSVPCDMTYLQYITEENYVETNDYSYIIKEIKNTDNKYVKVFCSADVETLKGSIFLYFDCYNKNLQQGYEYCVSQTNWTINYHSNDKTKITYQEPNKIAYDMLHQIADDYRQELWFDAKNQIVHIYDKIGVDFGAYYSNELQLKLLKRYSHTYDYATVLFPFGKNGLTINNVNNGRNYIENFNYSNKYIQAFYFNEDIEVPELLLREATNYLNEISQPKTSYELLVSQIGENINIGDNIIIVDKLKGVKQTQRVVKIKRYPYAPEKSKIEVNNLMTNFYDMFIKGQKRTDKDINYVRQVINNLQ